MDNAIQNYVAAIKVKHPELFCDNEVIEFGCLNVNGSVRQHFDSIKYIGVDANAGKDVDVRSLCHTYRTREEKLYDVVISTEMLEHDPYWDLSIVKMVNLVKDGGSLILTVAGPARHPHGQENYTPLNHYYRNISVPEALKFVSISNFKEIEVINKGDSFIYIFCYHKF